MRIIVLIAVSFAIAFFLKINKQDVMAGDEVATIEQGQLIPSSRKGDKGQYYLLEEKREGDYVKTLHKRIGVHEVGFTKAEVNCRTLQYRVEAYGEGSVDQIKNQPTVWTKTVDGSSKSDLVNFACR